MLCSFTIFQVNFCVVFFSHKNASIDYEVTSKID